MYKVLKDFTTPLHRFKAYPANPDDAVIFASDIDGPLGVDYYLQHKYIAPYKPLKTHMIESDKPQFGTAFSEHDELPGDRAFEDSVIAKSVVKDKKP